MFNNATIYEILALPESLYSIEEGLGYHAFLPCGANQEKSIGWVPPRGYENGPLAESIAGQIILKLMIEEKKVPADVVARKVEEECKRIEATTGRKPGKKEMRELKEDARNAMLPNAFPKRTTAYVWIDRENKILVIDSASSTRTDTVITALIKSLDGAALGYINTQSSPASSMARWLATKEAPEDFTVDRECELKACDESKAVVKYGRHPLDIDEVAHHVSQGKIPTKLALTYGDRVSFLLTDSMVLKKIAMLDSTIDVGMTLEDEAFDADVAIVTGELQKLIPSLIDVLGGKATPKQ